jgi:homocysteine S-methyltransferase
MSPFEAFFRAQGVVILDGGLATALEARGHDLDDPLWSARVLLDAPEEVSAVHGDYLDAGADCIASVTYQATFEGFGARGLGDAEAAAAFDRAVTLAVEARNAFWNRPTRPGGRLRPLVAASVGPYGAYLADGSEYTGDYDLDEDGLLTFHRRRWDLLARSDADLLACETIPSLVETRALLRLLAETPGRWAWLAFQCRDRTRLADGSPVSEAVRLCRAAPRVAAVGFNCVPPSRVAPLLRLAAAGAGDVPLAAYPNSGEAYDAGTKSWDAAAETWDPGTHAETWRRAGARIIGGCCRTTPDDIRRMRQSLLGPTLLPSSESE